MLIKIFDKTGRLKAELSPENSSTQVKEIQGDNVLSLSFSLSRYVAFDVDDYADFMFERYRLTKQYRPKQKSTVEWAYNLKMYGIESLIKKFLVIKSVDGDNEPVFTLTASPREHLALIVRCINDGFGTNDWKVGKVEGADNIVIDYRGKYCDEALRDLAEKTGQEYWAEGTTINLCRCEHGEPITLGYDKGLTSLDSGESDNVKFYTRIFPVGSSRNIDQTKYGSSRLRLPGRQRYVEVNADKYSRVDHYEESAFADIYPRYTGTVSSVRSEERIGEDGNKFTVYYFKDDNLPFDPNQYEIGGLVKRVSFQEGSELAGLGNEDNGTYYFEVNYDSDTREFEIITIWPYDDGTQLPGSTLVPKPGDRYIPWNIRMPDEYYALAEAELLEAVNKYNAEHALDVAVYKAPTDHVWIEQNNIYLSVGRRVRLESEEYFPGIGYRDSRITKITRKVNLPSQMELEIGDALSRRTLDKVQDNITSIKNYVENGKSELPDIIRTGDSTKATDNNLLSALRIYRDLLRKDRNDRTPYQLASDLGFEVGNFLAGVSGGMFGIDKADGQSFAEVAKLFVYGKAFFETLTTIEAQTLAGKQYITPGGAIKCSKVEHLKDTDGNVTAYRCYFLSEQDGEKTETKIIAGDQAISEMFNAKSGTSNKISNHRYWRYVNAVNNDAYTDDAGNHYGYIDLLASDCLAGSDIPQAGDIIDQLGNRTDATRQTAIVFSTVDADSPSIKMFGGIGSGDTNAEHYSLNGKAIISFGRDATTGKVYFRLGSSDATQYLDYTQDGGLKLAGTLSIGSHIGDKTVTKFVEDLIPEAYDDTAIKSELDKYKYLKAALKDKTTIQNSLILSGLVSLGSNNEDFTTQTTWSGISGIYDETLGGRSIASWYGGDMIDRYNALDVRLNEEGVRYAASLFRMDGSGYLADGMIRWRSREQGGGLILGDGITLDISGNPGLTSTLQSIINFRLNFSRLIKPQINAVTDTDWDDLNANTVRITGDLVADGIVSASAGAPGSIAASALSDLTDVTLSGLQNGQALVFENGQWVNKAIAGGLDETALGTYLTTNNYAKKSDIPSNYVTLDTAQTITAEKTFTGYICHENPLMFKHASHQSGVYLSPQNNGSLDISTHTDYTWVATIASFQSSGIFRSFYGVTAPNFYVPGGASTQFLKADGSLDSNAYVKALAGSECDGIVDINDWQSYKTVIGSADINGNSPSGSRAWFNVIQLAHRNGGSDGPDYVGQIAVGMTVHDRMWFRSHRTRSWLELIHSGNYASMLDGRYVKKSGDTMTGALKIESQSGLPLWLNKIGSNGYIQIGNTGAEFGCYAGLGAYMQNDDVAGAPTICLNSGDLNAPKFRFNGGLYNIWHAGNSRVKQFYTLDLSGYDSGTFYPIVWPTTYQTIECEVWSPNLGGADPYNCNRIHFLLRSNGWSDDGNTITILSRHNYDNGEITIGAIGRGNTNGYKAIWLRGGKVYQFQTDYIPSFSGGSWSSGNENFTPGPNYWGGSNSNVSILWTNDGTRWERDLATLSSNVASATKLQTARSIWGHSFNGENNVSGDMYNVNHIFSSGYFYSNISGTKCSVLDFHSDGSLALNYGLYQIKGLPCKIYGNVIIGTETSSNKLTVNGDIYATSGWLRTYGQNGLHFESYGGGIYMTDSTWIRTYNNKRFYCDNVIRSDTRLEVGGDGSAFYTNSAGTVRASGEIISTFANAFRAIQGNYGFIIRNDGSNTYFLFTNAGNQYGGWNHLRPFYISNISGDVTMEHNLEVRGNIMCKGVVAAAA